MCMDDPIQARSSNPWPIQPEGGLVKQHDVVVGIEMLSSYLQRRRLKIAHSSWPWFPTNKMSCCIPRQHCDDKQQSHLPLRNWSSWRISKTAREEMQLEKRWIYSFSPAPTQRGTMHLNRLSDATTGLPIHRYYAAESIRPLSVIRYVVQVGCIF